MAQNDNVASGASILGLALLMGLFGFIGVLLEDLKPMILLGLTVWLALKGCKSFINLHQNHRTAFLISGLIGLALAAFYVWIISHMSIATIKEHWATNVMLLLFAFFPPAIITNWLRGKPVPPSTNQQQSRPYTEFMSAGAPNTAADDGEFEFDASAFEGGGDDTDDKLWNMAQDPRTPEPERQAAMKAIQKRGAKPKQITHRKV